MSINIPDTKKKRIVIIGAGFAGLAFTKKMAKQDVQVVLIDKNNYHQFQPLFYQVAMAGLEPSSISFPLRKLFQRKKNVFIRITAVLEVRHEKKEVLTELGSVSYDALVIATGTKSNYFGNEELAQKTIPMKSVGEALYLRNRILKDYEQALVTKEYDERQGLVDIVIVGGGPTGVEIAGALVEMKEFILPKDYVELDNHEVDIILVQGGPCLLQGMSEHASDGALEFLQKMGVDVRLNCRVESYDGDWVSMSDGNRIRSKKVIWAAGVKGVELPGLDKEYYNKASRLIIDEYCNVVGLDNVYALGDIAIMQTKDNPKGHPQLAQVAIQQGIYLAANFNKIYDKSCEKKFRYNDKGSMATVGRNKAVVDLPRFKFKGFFAWIVWLFVHLFAILGVKNKVFIFINWFWNYFSYDQSLRLIIKAEGPEDRQAARAKAKPSV